MKLLRRIWPLLASNLLMLAICFLCMSILSSMRAYVGGESLWSKAQKDAVTHLRQFARDGDIEEFARFRQALSIPMGDRAARLELLKPAPDFAVASAGFLAGGNDPKDVPGMIRLFRVAEHVPYMQRVLQIWAEGDGLIDRLDDVADQLLDEVTAARLDPSGRAALLSQINAIDFRLRPLEDEFSSTLGASSRLTTVILAWTAALSSLVFLGIGIALSGSILARADSMELALRHQASHDELTGLVNRREFERRLSAALAPLPDQREPGALLYLDLDQFKIVNDTCGHHAGDELIRRVADTIRAAVRSSDTIGRLGGDEFGLLLPACAPAAALSIAETIRSNLTELRFSWGGRTFLVGASIGVVMLERGFGTVAEALSAADSACYLAKDSGRNRVQVFRQEDRQIQVRAEEMNWVVRLEDALEHSRFELFAQEIRPIAGPRLDTSYEILLRLRDKDGRLIEPMEFLPAAERYGLMKRLDRWVIERTIQRLGAVRDVATMPRLAVNLSAASLGDGELLGFISSRLREHEVAPHRLGFEVTETAAISELAAAELLLESLRKLGCSIGLDDFGSGMSSFGYLRRLPIDYVKIDGEFVQAMNKDPVKRAIVASMHQIARVMGLRTVAEHVEGDAVLALLREIGVDYAQGFAIGIPAPLAELVVSREQVPAGGAGWDAAA
ncbi:MAG: EAL domain-containing protein [Burkholderiaceae bacterium]|nr:EAL domain-containing protein [Burkholderiaceae bacterium]